MKTKQLKTNLIYLLLVILLQSTSTFAQVICEIEDRNLLYKGKEQFSGLAYHPKTGIFFVPFDRPVSPSDDLTAYPSISMIGYNLEENTSFEVTFSGDTKLLTGDDYEGITHLKEDYFALLEEIENKIYFLKYIPNNKEFEVLSAHETDIDLTNSTDGLGGISYDPNTRRLYVVSERDDNQGNDMRLYSASVELPDGDFKGAITSSFLQSRVSLGASFLASGLFHLGQIYPANHPLANNILLTSWYTKKMFEYKITSLDQNNNLQALELKKEINFNAIPTTSGKVEHKPGGIVATDNKIYVVSENLFDKEAGLSSYDVKSQYDSCLDNTWVFNENCDCVLVDCETNELVQATETNASNDLLVLYESSQLIETETTTSLVPDVIIRENEAVNLKSDHITLNEGFKVESGACLNAEIAPCK